MRERKYPIVITFKIDEELLEILDKYALVNSMSRSEVIRRALEKYLGIRRVRI